jgi:hypothetical protein
VKTLQCLLVVLVIVTSPASAQSDSQRGWRILIDGEEVGGAIERIDLLDESVISEQELRFQDPSSTGTDAHAGRERAVENLDGELLELRLESGPATDSSVLVAVREEQQWLIRITGSFGEFERNYDASETLIGPTGERKRIQEDLLSVGDRIEYMQLDTVLGRPARMTAELVEMLDDEVRLVVRTARDRPGKTTFHFDRQGTVLYSESELTGGGSLVMELIDHEQAAELIAAIDLQTGSDEPGLLETDIQFLEGSGIVINELDANREDRLVLLARVWGFLKYHHPVVTSGDKHWDFELFRMLPDYLEAGDAKAFLVDWINGLGELDPCDPCAGLPYEMHVAPNLDWLSDESLLSTDLSRTLRHVHRQRSADAGQFFVNISAGAGFADFRRELAYEDVDLNDSGFRLLTLYRWWNIIEYWFPYRYMIDGDWSNVLVEFLPRVLLADSSEDYRLELVALATRIGDGHVGVRPTFDVLTPTGACRWPTAGCFLGGKPGVVAVAEQDDAALQTGDIIRTIDGPAVDELIAGWLPYYSGSNEPAQLHLMSFVMGRGPCGTSELTVDREGVIETLAVERRDERPPQYVHDLPGETIRMLSENVAYLTLSSFDAARVDEYLEVMAGAKALVIDIRNYPADFAVFSLGQHLVDRPTDFARFISGRMNAPGAFAWGPTVSLDPREPHFAGRIAILVDEASMSQSEYTAMAFRAAPDAVVVGSTTAGANGNVATFALPGGLVSSISGIGAYYADGSPMQRIGIVADIPAASTIDGFRAGRDEILEAALRHLLGDDLTETEIRNLARLQP